MAMSWLVVLVRLVLLVKKESSKSKWQRWQVKVEAEGRMEN